nr:MAG TPA: hypothetical protein [Caudoviricetes sp.]
MNSLSKPPLFIHCLYKHSNTKTQQTDYLNKIQNKFSVS